MGFFFRHKTADIPKTTRLVPDESVMGYQIEALQGVGSRKEQQDCYCTVNANDVIGIQKRGLLAVVADGMGGMVGGQYASRTVAATMQNDFRNMDLNGNIPVQLCTAIIKANETVYNELGGKGGSTVIAAAFFEQKMYFACVGDSGLYLFRNGEVTRLNRVQNCLHRNYVGIICDGSMDPESANSNPEKAPLVQYVGMGKLTDIDHIRRPLPLQQGDTVLLCSDGVDGVMTEDVLRDCLAGESAKEICQRLERQIVRAKKNNQDNYTAIVVKCT